MIEVAKVSSQGQITIPADIRKRLGLSPGGKIAFVTNQQGEIVLANASLLALSRAQADFKGATEKAGVDNEKSLLSFIKENR